MAGPFGDMLSFRVTGARSLSSTQVLVTFSLPLDPGYAPFLNPENYSIQGLTVVAAAFQDTTTVLLTTTPQVYIPYTVVVAQGQALGGAQLASSHRTTIFTGTPTSPTFGPVGVRSDAIRLVFTEPMLLSTVIVPAAYTVRDLQGNTLTVVSVTPEQGAANPQSVVLGVSPTMTATEWYVVTVGGSVVSAAEGLPVSPETRQFSWVTSVLNVAVPILRFSGEAKEGFLGQHAGLVYFSPALDAAMSGSAIQIDSVEVCTKAYDHYKFPQPPDPPVLFTYGGPTGTWGVLNSSNAVLWGTFPRLSEVYLEVETRHEDAFPQAVDSSATATLTETLDPSYVALLNNPGWTLFDGLASTPPTFICANNLAPIPPGSTTVVVLHP